MVFLGERQDHPQGNRLTRKENGMTDLTLETVRQEAAKLIPVLVTRSGAEVKEFIKATVTTTTDEVLE